LRPEKRKGGVQTLPKLPGRLGTPFDHGEKKEEAQAVPRLWELKGEGRWSGGRETLLRGKQYNQPFSRLGPRTLGEREYPEGEKKGRIVIVRVPPGQREDHLGREKLRGGGKNPRKRKGGGGAPR